MHLLFCFLENKIIIIKGTKSTNTNLFKKKNFQSWGSFGSRQMVQSSWFQSLFEQRRPAVLINGPSSIPELEPWTSSRFESNRGHVYPKAKEEGLLFWSSLLKEIIK